MTLGNLLSQMGMDSKHLTERHSHAEYSAPTHDHMFYAYEPSQSHGPVAASKHHYGGGGGHKNNAAMSALTLLAFLFFLHILQQCLKDHMTSMSTPPVMIMTAGRGGEEAMPKRAIVNKIDKSGITTPEAKSNPVIDVDVKSKMNGDQTNTKYDNDASNKDTFMKIQTAEYTPKISAHHTFKQVGNRSLSFPGYVSAMNED